MTNQPLGKTTIDIILDFLEKGLVITNAEGVYAGQADLLVRQGFGVVKVYPSVVRHDLENYK